MQLNLVSSVSEKQLLKLEYPAGFISNNHFGERNTLITDSWGNLSFKELWFEGAGLYVTTFNVNTPCLLNLQCDSFCWLMNFVLEGEISTHLNSDTELSLQDGNYHTFSCPRIDTSLLVVRPTRVLTVCLTRRFIIKLIGKDILKETLGSNAENIPTLIATGNYLHTRLNTLVKEILSADQPGYIRRIYLESKILELLSVQLEKLERRQVIPNGFNPEDITRLHDAKNVIAANLQTPCSLIELARKTGLNDFKLKKGFKALFGHTVFGYLFELRMNTAYNLLQDDKSVSEVAEIIGYKNAHHFTAAFKKRYGLLPSQVSKMSVL
jgi:AraC-like DNA-binding protein